MSNLGIHHFLKEERIDVAVSPVGDQNVLELMLKSDYALGGEQSGHIIFLDHLSTGAGELSAVQFLSVLKELGEKCSTLASMVPKYPQVLINIKIENAKKEAAMADPKLQETIRRYEGELSDKGRILVRASGTEPLIRVMVEGQDEACIQKIADDLADMIKSC